MKKQFKIENYVLQYIPLIEKIIKIFAAYSFINHNMTSGKLQCSRSMIRDDPGGWFAGHGVNSNGDRKGWPLRSAIAQRTKISVGGTGYVYSSNL